MKQGHSAKASGEDATMCNSCKISWLSGAVYILFILYVHAEQIKAVY